MANSSPSSAEDISGYAFSDAGFNQAHAYLMPAVTRVLQSLPWDAQKPRRIFEIGCGNGVIANELSKLKYDVTGIDPSEEGIQHARKTYPHLNLSPGSAYEDLAGKFGRFPVVLSLEVVEHVYYPRKFAATAFNLLEPGGTAIISTPYHGYLKNLALAVTGAMDRHFTVLWDYGHIKFWSIKTLRTLLLEAGFRDVQFKRIGRVPTFAKSMLAVAVK